MIKISKWQVITFLSIFIAYAIGISLLNDDSSRETLRIMFYWVIGIVALFFLISWIRYKIKSE